MSVKRPRKKSIRRNLFEVIAPHYQAAGNSALQAWSRAYDVVLIVCICASIYPLFFKQDPPFMVKINHYLPIVFIVDYILGWVTADFRLKKHRLSFLLYPLTLWAIVDLLAIIPFFINASETLVLLRILRLIRISRIFKGLRYSDNFGVFKRALKKQKDTLLSLLIITLAYIVISGLIIFHAEPDAFAGVQDAFMMSASLLTGGSVGLGIALETMPAKIIALFSAFWGIALIALPAGVLTGGFITELHLHQLQEKRREAEEKKREEKRRVESEHPDK